MPDINRAVRPLPSLLTLARLQLPYFTFTLRACVALLLLSRVVCWPAVLFEDDFDRGMPGWTAVQPWGAYLDGPLRWHYDVVSDAFAERSNIYTDSATFSPTAIAPMLINDALTAVNFTYSARLTAGDDDGFGLIFGYRDDQNFYRVTFARQSRTGGFPWTGWSVDRKVAGDTVTLFGAGTAGYTQTFLNTANRPFDVTVSVDTANRLTLTVVDNPLGSLARTRRWLPAKPPLNTPNRCRLGMPPSTEFN